MRRLGLVAALILSGAMGSDPCVAAVRVTELLMEGQQGESGFTPAYMEISAPLHDQPFDLVVLDVNAWWDNRVQSVVRVDGSDPTPVWVVHEPDWSKPPPGERVETTDLGFTGGVGGWARAVLAYDDVTTFEADVPAELVLDEGGWVDQLVYSVGDAPVDDIWGDVLHFDEAGAIYRAREAGGGVVWGSVEDLGDGRLAFDNGRVLDPGDLNPRVLDDDMTAVVPEPGSAALLGLITAALAVRGRARGDRRRARRNRGGQADRSAVR